MKVQLASLQIEILFYIDDNLMEHYLDFKHSMIRNLRKHLSDLYGVSDAFMLFTYLVQN